MFVNCKAKCTLDVPVFFRGIILIRACVLRVVQGFNFCTIFSFLGTMPVRSELLKMWASCNLYYNLFNNVWINIVETT